MGESETVDFRDSETVYLRDVKRPTFLYDVDTKSRLKYGEYEFVLASMEHLRKAYMEAGYPEMGEALRLVEIQPNQKFVDLVFQSDGMFKKFVAELGKSDGVIH